MAKTKQVKLGEAANSFYDPVSQVKVLPGQVIELDEKAQKSKKISVALRHGHLVLASDEDVEAAAAGNTVSNNDQTNDVDTNWDDFEYSEENLMKLKKPQLVELAMHLESEYSQEELNGLNKTELTEEILEIVEDKE